jgi:hypothetical protein
MKAIDGRLRRLQEIFAPEVREEDFRVVNLLRERRRRRLEASGEPFESGPSERLTDEQTMHLSVADVLRIGRRRVTALERQPG